MSEALRGRVRDQDDLAVALGGRIRQARNARGVTLRELAAELGVSPATMSAVENGRTSVSAVRLTEIAALLDVPVDRLLTGDERDEAGAANAPDDTAWDWRVFEPAPFDGPLQAALEAFMEVGYHGSTMRDIARRAQLSVPGIYHHYASKQEMLVRILDHTMDDLLWRFDAAVAEADDLQGQFVHAVECLALFHTFRRDWGFLGRSEQRSLEGDAAVRIRDKRIRVEKGLLDLVERGRDEATFATSTPRVAGRAVILMCVGLVYWFRVDGPEPPEVIARQYVELALRMVEHVPRDAR